ncbi:MAG: ribosome-associated translation inhibitor RaiA [Flavobacteriales bacterium]|jgi:putative sigma-54 modulation protein|nr:ribosome-associated translation inhibitor RaiA [Flavobacteriales bacterium]MBT5749747.1 ribosome-associated translation inhibitor RaiA [Flavobacteriales bacterium]
MNIEIQSVHFAADKQLKTFISKKVEKLISIDHSIINANVYLKVDKPESFDNKIVEIKLHSSLGEYFAKKQANSFEESTDLVSQALRKQILKHKEK